jgi:aminoglycoside phosphotransferase family enzyme/predicted kinase
VTSPAIRETHIGLVILAADRAYKIKKPVATEFLDFSTPQRRLAACRREVELNRRLAPDVYLGVWDIVPHAEDDRPSAVEPVEHVVVMRRMPEDRRLSELVSRGAPVEGQLRALARLMAGFHAGADRGPEISTAGGRDALRARWEANVAELRPFAGTVLDPQVVDALGRLSLRFLAGRAALFADRVTAGRVVDGHGDLLAADVFFLDDGPRVLDCLEFDDRLRFVDGLDDVAFLAMDLERLGRPDLAQRFLDDYVEFSGDPAPAALRAHYVAYRAVVRAKVAGLRFGQGDPAAAAEAVEHAALALRHLEVAAVRLALVGGLPGTGKTTLGGALADRFGAVLISSDRVRKEIAGIDPLQPAPAAFGEGLYTAPHTEGLYAELLRRAGQLLARGESVVLDASWTRAAFRNDAEALARQTHSELVPLCCEAPAATARTRIAVRTGTTSDATATIAAAMAGSSDPWPESVPIRTDGTLEQALEQASAVWRAAPAGRPR